MSVSYPPNTQCAPNCGVSLDDWNLLFDAVLARLSDTVLRDASDHAVCPVVLECVAALAQLRQLHPVAAVSVR